MHTSPRSVDPCDDGSAPVTTTRPQQLPRRPAAEAASPAAVDEVFANLARVDASRRADARSILRPLRATQFRDAPLRDLAAALERQHERLVQLLRDIDGPTATN